MVDVETRSCLLQDDEVSQGIMKDWRYDNYGGTVA